MLPEVVARNVVLVLGRPDDQLVVALNSPSRRPRPSAFSRRTSSSNQMSWPPSVEVPRSFSTIEDAVTREEVALTLASP